MQPRITSRTFLKTLRSILGWICIILGIFLFWLPVPLGIPFILIGTLLIGRRNRFLRRVSVSVKLLLRRWAALRVPVIGPIGRRLLRAQRHISSQLRRYHWWRMMD